MATRKINPYKVPKKQWNKWSPHAQALFNNLYCEMKMSQWAFHPHTEHKLSDDQWSTIAWNVAFMAACLLDDTKE